jgi:hypothetical protein
VSTARQIAANRANAKLSTGPRTVAGKKRSSRNAFKHGFSASGVPNSLSSVEPLSDVVRALVAQLRKESPRATHLAMANFVRAQIDVLRIRSARAAAFDILEVDAGTSKPEALREIAALDRYERYALTKRRRASEMFVKK